MDHGLETKVNLAATDNLGDILVFSRVRLARTKEAFDLDHTLGSLGSSIATLIPSSLK